MRYTDVWPELVFGVRFCSRCPCENSRVLLIACVYKQSRIRAETCPRNVAKGMCVSEPPKHPLSLSPSTSSVDCEIAGWDFASCELRVAGQGMSQSELSTRGIRPQDRIQV